MKKITVSTLASALLCSSALSGAPLPQQVIDQASQILIEQSIQQETQLKKDLKESTKKSTIEIVPTLPKISTTSSAMKFIKEIQISGSSLLPQTVLNPILMKYSNKELGIQEIQLLMGELTMAYIDLGYSTTRIYIPIQDLSSQILKLNVVEGVIENINVNDNAEGKSISIVNIFPNMIGKALNIYDIEQGLDQINRLSSNNAKMEIIPSSKDGQSVIVVKNEVSKPWAFSMDTDNTGSQSTGRWQHGINLSYDNLLGYNDFVSLSAKSTLLSYDDKSSKLGSFTYSVPFGYTTASINLSRSQFDNIITSDSGDINIDGTTKNISVILDHVIVRGKGFKVTGTTSLNKKNTEFNILDEPVSVLSPKLAVWDMSIKGFFIAGDAMTCNWSLTHSKGLALFGAQKDAGDIESDEAHAQFSKIQYDFGLSKRVPIENGTSVSFSSQFSGMRTNSPLYSSEQFMATGRTGVRGFYETALTGNKGYNVRNDIKWDIPSEIAGNSLMTSLYYSYDFGKTLTFQSTEGSSVGGNALGINLNYKNISTSLEYSKQLWKPATMQNESGITTFRLSVQF